MQICLTLAVGRRDRLDQPSSSEDEYRAQRAHENTYPSKQSLLPYRQWHQWRLKRDIGVVDGICETECGDAICPENVSPERRCLEEDETALFRNLSLEAADCLR